MSVSNPNGVNLHKLVIRYIKIRSKVSNPNGVNLHKIFSHIFVFCNRSFKPQRGKFTLIIKQYPNPHYVVSNPNGVNLHSAKILIFRAVCDKSLYFYALK